MKYIKIFTNEGKLIKLELELSCITYYYCRSIIGIIIIIIVFSISIIIRKMY